jgi:Lon protease-like protein
MIIDGAERIEELPIFPLATVLFPGSLLPLHIFEERYKEMMRFAIENEGLFGLSYRSDAEVGKETVPEPGSIGCVAKINAVMQMEEGRMNLLSIGVIRYRVIAFRQLTPFLIAQVEPFTDDLEMDSDLTALFDETVEVARRFFAAVEALSDLNAPSNVSFPEEAEEFSLFVAAHLPLEADEKQSLLEMTSTRMRLHEVKNCMADSLPDYERRIEMRDLARGNGHGKVN